MSAIGPVYPAQIVVIQAEVRLVADETGNANTEAINPISNASQLLRKLRRQRPTLLVLISSPESLTEER